MLIGSIDAEVGETEQRQSQHWSPPHMPTLHGQCVNATTFAVYDRYWYAIVQEAANPGSWAHLWEWTENDWQYVTKLHGRVMGEAFGKALDAARGRASDALAYSAVAASQEDVP